MRSSTTTTTSTSTPLTRTLHLSKSWFTLTLLLLVQLCFVPLTTASQASEKGYECFYASRQSNNQVLVFSQHFRDEHYDHFETIHAIDTYPNPSGLTTHKHLLYVGSYGDLKNVKGNIQVFDLRDLRMIYDFSHLEELKDCYPEALLVYQGYLYVACGALGKGILKIEIEKKFVKEVFAKEIPVIWGLTAKENYLYISSHCQGQFAEQGHCQKDSHDTIFRVDLNDDKLQVHPFAHNPGEEFVGFGDLGFGPDNNLYAITFTQNSVLKFSSEGEFIKNMNFKYVEYPVGISFKDTEGYVGSPGRGEIYKWNIKTERQDLFAHPGPYLNSKIGYLIWARCPLRIRDEL